MSAPALPVAAPSQRGVDARGVLALVDALDASPTVEPHSLLVARGGAVVAAGWWAPFTRERPHLLYSLSKSFTSAAAGLAGAEGLLDLDEPVVDAVPDLAADLAGDLAEHPRTRALRLRHLLSMASGHTRDTWLEAVARDRGEPVRGFLSLTPDRDPGSVFAYNQPCTYTVAAVLQRRAGLSLTDYLRPRLLDPLGIGEVGWQQHPVGRDLGFTGLHATTDAVLRLGLLHLQGGTWAGRRVLPEGWVEEATRVHVPTAGSGQGSGPDWELGYGYQFWTSRHGYRGDGAYGQFCLVLPEHDAVVAITSATQAMQDVLDAVWQHLLPALGTSGGSPDDDAALADRLARLALPPLGAAVRLSPEPPGGSGRWDGGTWAPDDDARAAQPTLTGASLRRDPSPATGTDGWQLVLREGGAALPARLGTDGWAVSEPAGPDGRPVPVAVSGGWDGDRLRADVLFLETPHRLHLRLRSDGALGVRWGTVPLRAGALSDLRCPR